MTAAQGEPAYHFVLGDPPPRIEKIGKEAELPLLRDGKIACEIVLVPEASPVVRYAASELQSFLNRAFGATVPVVPAPTGVATAIILGDTSYSRKLEIDVDRLPKEGCAIKSGPKQIIIAGQDDPAVNPAAIMRSRAPADHYYKRGTLTGVYEFLERFIKVRFYFPGEIGTVIPQYHNLILPSMEIMERPDWSQRELCWWSGKWYDAKSPDWTLNYYRLRLSNNIIPFGHGLSRFSLTERFGKSHPEYFTLLSNGRRQNDKNIQHYGQLCFSSDVWSVIKEDVKAYFNGQTAASRQIIPDSRSNAKGWSIWTFQPGMVGLNPQDGFYFCKCDKCRQYYDRGGSAASTLVWSRIAGVASYLKEQNIPGFVNGLAYHFFDRVPDCELPDNMVISLASNGPWVAHLPPMQNDFKALLQGWTKKVNGKILFRHYALNDVHDDLAPEIPAMTPRTIAGFYEENAPYLAGGYLEGSFVRYIQFYLNHYVFAKVAWNNRTDIEVLLAEHHRLMFGPAAEPMSKFYNRIEELWLGGIVNRAFNTPLGPVIGKASKYDIWEKVFSPDELKQQAAWFDEAEKLAADNPEALSRVKFIRRELFEPMRQAAANYSAEKQNIKNWRLAGRKLAGSEQIVLDGKLEEPVWQRCPAAWLLPFNSEQQEVNTRVKAARDDHYLYLGIECDEPLMNQLIAPPRKQGDREIYEDSAVEIFINPSGDLKRYYQFMINAAGSIAATATGKTEAIADRDWTWNSSAEVKTTRETDRWTVEIKIPLDKMDALNPNGFPVNFTRNRRLTDTGVRTKYYSWSPFMKGGFHEPENFGVLDFAVNAAKPMVTNGNFTDPRNGRYFGPWTASVWNNDYSRADDPGDKVALDKTTWHTGGQSVCITGGNNRTYLRVQLPNLKPSTCYRLTGSLKLDNIVPTGEIGGVRFNVLDGKNHWLPVNPYTGTMPWTRQSFTFTSNPGTGLPGTVCYLSLVVMNCTGRAWFDAIQLEEVK